MTSARPWLCPESRCTPLLNLLPDAPIDRHEILARAIAYGSSAVVLLLRHTERDLEELLRRLRVLKFGGLTGDPAMEASRQSSRCTARPTCPSARTLSPCTRAWEGLKFPQIAERLGVTPQRAGQIYRDAVRKLLRGLDLTGDGGDVS